MHGHINVKKQLQIRMFIVIFLVIQISQDIELPSVRRLVKRLDLLCQKRGCWLRTLSDVSICDRTYHTVSVHALCLHETIEVLPKFHVATAVSRADALI
jgi:hypothetical protein